MTCGIYAIVCDKTWRSYVGQTVNLETRYHDHCQKLRRKAHENSELQRDFNLYGELAFHYEILEYLEDEHLAGQRETYWMGFGESLYNKTNPNTKIELTEEELVRFWKWVEIKSEDECWNWIGAKDKDGYGRISFVKNGKKRTYRSNRISYYTANPESDVHLVVRHTCNNSSCCNPNHLITGTSSQNRLDTLNSANNNFKLNWLIVKDIRNKFLENPDILPDDLNTWVVNNYNINTANCHLIEICTNKKWVDSKYIPPNRQLRYYLTDDDRELILKYIESGLGKMEISRKMINIHKLPSSQSSIIRNINKLINKE